MSKKIKENEELEELFDKTIQDPDLTDNPWNEPQLSFDVWFSTLGVPRHWKEGMRAFHSTSGRRSKKQWDQAFQSYFNK